MDCVARKNRVLTDCSADSGAGDERKVSVAPKQKAMSEWSE
jgi:hypothetical protein